MNSPKADANAILRSHLYHWQHIGDCASLNMNDQTFGTILRHEESQFSCPNLPNTHIGNGLSEIFTLNKSRMHNFSAKLAHRHQDFSTCSISKLRASLYHFFNSTTINGNDKNPLTVSFQKYLQVIPPEF